MTSGDPPGRPWPGRPIVLLPALLAPVAVLLATLVRGRALLPVLATLAVYPVMAALIVRGRSGAAAAATLLWAASLSASIIAVTARDPRGMEDLVLRGPEYRDEMFAFIRSGAGRESDPRRFLVEHALHLGAFVALTVASGGFLGIALGAVLLGYMSFYVGALVAGSAPLLAATLGWPPWAVLRVVAFILLGVVLSRPLLSRLRGRPIPPAAERLWYLAAAGLLVADAALKALLAPAWAALLRPCLGP